MLEPQLQSLILGFAFIAGLCLGSFLNVVGLRFLAEKSLTQPPSHCPRCKTPIWPIDNIPVLSYIFLGGQCRACKNPISIQYPLIELSTGILFALVFWYFGLTWQTLFLLFLVSNLVVIFITDLRESLIFQINSLSLVPVGLIYNFFRLGEVKTTFPLDLGSIIIHVPDALISAVIAIIGAIVFFEGLILFSQVAFGTEGFGHGDTHLMMGVGAFLGWPLTLLALFLGFLAQTIPAVPILIFQWIQNKQYASLISGGVATIFGVMPLFLMNMDLNMSLRSLFSLGCMLLSIIALIVFLKQIKHSQSFTYLPLGPALVIGSLIALFLGSDIIHSYQGFLTR